jgi:hypothetical protein
MRRIVLFIAIGLVVGVAAGLTLGWLVIPVQYVDGPMRDLSRRHKDDYTVMIANAYQVDRDVNAAIQRLTPLEVENVPLYLRDVTERFISQRGTGLEADIRALVVLSCAMGYCTEPMQPFLQPVVPGAG